MSQLLHPFQLPHPASEVPFPSDEYQRRLNLLRSALAQHGVDVAFLSSPEAICWLTGDQAEWYQSQSSSAWPPSSGVAVNVEDGQIIHFDTADHVPRIRYTSIVEDIRFVEDVAANSDGVDLMDFIVAELRAEGWANRTVGLELGSYRPNPAVSARFTHALRLAGATISDITGILREARRLKSAVERSAVREAHEMAQVGLAAVTSTLSPGVTELEVYGELLSALAKCGSEAPGITLPVLSGAKTLCGHALASRKIIEADEVVVVDICGVRHRYHANIARTFYLGEPPKDLVQTVRNAAGAFAIAADVIRPWQHVGHFTKELRRYYNTCGLWDSRWYFGGYELGIAFPPDWVGEWLWECGRNSGDEIFEPGLVINMESNVILPRNLGRAMLINTLIVEDDHVEVLGSNAELIILI